MALAKLAVSVALITLVVRVFDVRGVMGHIARIDAASAALAVGIALAAVPLQTARWLVVQVESGTRLPFARALTIVLIGHFFNQTLPSSVGGDAMRMWCAHRAGMTPGSAVTTVILDRAASLLGLLFLMACGLPWLPGLVSDPVAGTAIVAAVVGGIGGFLVVALLTGSARSFPQWRMMRPLSALLTSAHRVFTSPRCLLPILLLGVAGGTAFSGIIFVLARALGAELAMKDCLLLVPPVLLVSAVPVSVAGWGVREGAMVVALGLLGVAPDTAFSVSVLFGLVVAAASLPGAGLWLAGGYSSEGLKHAVNFAKEASMESASAEDRARSGQAHGKP